jgi:hypothetical protein
MRGVLTAVVLIAGAGVVAQAPPQADKKAPLPPPRYGLSANPDYYPQSTAKDAVASAAKALENRRYDYLAAHLLDPAVVDGKVAERATALESEVEKELATLRAAQRRNPGAYPAEELLPPTPPEFAERVRAEATARAFRAVVKSVADTLNESPENARLLAKFAREGEVAESGAAATVSLKAGTAKKVFLKQEGGRWFVEDRQREEVKKDAPSTPQTPPKVGK